MQSSANDNFGCRVPTWEAEKQLTALLESPAMNEPAADQAELGPAAAAGIEGEVELIDRIGLSRHPKSAILLKGLGAEKPLTFD